MSRPVDLGVATDFDRMLSEMRSEIESGPEIYYPSSFWTNLNARNTTQLSERGFTEFKRTVNQNYFNWVIGRPWDAQFRALFADWIRHPSPSALFASVVEGSKVETSARRIDSLSGRRARLLYAVFVAMLWEHARRRDLAHVLERLVEPELGEPVLVRHRGQLISQDVANSALEVFSIEEAFGGRIPAGATVIELGGGYGRLGWALLSLVPGVRYFAVDIPPALAVAEEYLTRLFPTLPTVRFRRGTDHLADELKAARLAFMTPNQFEVAASTIEANLFVNISSLHEMRRDQVGHYLELAGTVTRGIAYLKQWRSWTNPDDRITMTEHDYPIPTSWNRIFWRRHSVQRHFFEAAFRV